MLTNKKNVILCTKINYMNVKKKRFTTWNVNLSRILGIPQIADG